MMAKMAVSVLVECFDALSKPRRERLREQVRRKTRILCGKNASEFVDGNGGG